MKKYPNPWNLTPQQEAVMDSVCEHGCRKLAARALGITLKTIDVHLLNVAYKMGEVGKPGGLLRYIRWVKYRMGVHS